MVEIDGFTVTSSSNTISTALEGVTISAKSLGSSTLNIARDDTAIQESVQKFADSYNALRTEINSQRTGQLEGDNTLLIIERQLADVLSSGLSNYRFQVFLI
ncbi:MAG: flagellar filament capping protein FliD [Gammaproteobacteria bacterium]|nr:flagellar filament capping protein FliD [Gammaproteobacteria bacterium]